MNPIYDFDSKANSNFSKNGCAILIMIFLSFETITSFLLSMMNYLSINFSAYIFAVSFFCTKYTLLNPPKPIHLITLKSLNDTSE